MSSGTVSLAFNLPQQQGSTLSYQAFLVIFFAVAFSSILIVLYTDFIKTTFYGTFGLSDKSSWNALIIALFVTVLFILLVYIITSYDLLSASNEVSTITGGFPPGANSFVFPTSSAPTSLNNNMIPQLFNTNSIKNMKRKISEKNNKLIKDIKKKNINNVRTKFNRKNDS